MPQVVRKIQLESEPRAKQAVASYCLQACALFCIHEPEVSDSRLIESIKVSSRARNDILMSFRPRDLLVARPDVTATSCPPARTDSASPESQLLAYQFANIFLCDKDGHVAQPWERGHLPAVADSRFVCFPAPKGLPVNSRRFQPAEPGYLSTAIATAFPPPRHSAAMPFFAFRAIIS